MVESSGTLVRKVFCNREGKKKLQVCGGGGENVVWVQDVSNVEICPPGFWGTGTSRLVRGRTGVVAGVWKTGTR